MDPSRHETAVSMSVQSGQPLWAAGCLNIGCFWWTCGDRAIVLAQAEVHEDMMGPRSAGSRSAGSAGFAATADALEEAAQSVGEISAAFAGPFAFDFDEERLQRGLVEIAERLAEAAEAAEAFANLKWRREGR